MFLTIVFGVFVVLFIVLLYEDYVSKQEDVVMHQRLESLNMYHTTNEERIKQQSLITRLLDVSEKKIMGLFGEQLKSAGNVGKLQAKLIKAGVASEIDPLQIRAQRFIYGIIMAFIALMCFKEIGIALAGGAVGFLLPDAQLNGKINKRKEIIKDEIPDFLDLLAATFPGSKGFEDAIDKICKRSSGIIPDEFQKYVNEYNAGKRKKDALRALADRCGVNEVDMLVNQIIQSELLGTGLEDTLNSQAKKLRVLKKTQAEIKARRISMSMMFSILFMMAAILIVVAGPSLIQIFDTMAM